MRGGACVPSGLLNIIQHGTSRDVLKSGFEVKGKLNPCWVKLQQSTKIVLIMVLVKGASAVGNRLFLGSMTDTRATMRRNDTMRSGRWPPVDFARGVTWPDRRYCRTECGTAATPICATVGTYRLLSPACSPKSHQCSARRGPGLLSRGMRLRVVGMSSAIWDRKMCEAAVWAASAGCTGGAFLVAARAWLRSLVRAGVATLRTRDCLCSAADLVVPLEMRATPHSARTMDHRASDQKTSSRASRK